MSAAIEVKQLPDDVREKLAELELELSEGRISFNIIIVLKFRSLSILCIAKRELILRSNNCQNILNMHDKMIRFTRL